jgi:hypothetical protein
VPDEPDEATVAPEIVRPRPTEAFDITRRDEGSRVERISLLDPNSPAAVSARQLAQQVKRRATLRGVRSIVVTSPLSGDGKTTTSCNLAIALTRLDRSRSVILVEFDHQGPVAMGGDRQVARRDHIHTVVRTPNGNDYGKDLLRQHYEAHANDVEHGHARPLPERR